LKLKKEKNKGKQIKNNENLYLPIPRTSYSASIKKKLIFTEIQLAVWGKGFVGTALDCFIPCAFINQIMRELRTCAISNLQKSSKRPFTISFPSS